MSNKAFSLVSGSCKLATRCSIFNAWLFDEDVLFELLVCCCVCAACAAIIIARTNRPIDWKRFDSLSALKAFRTRLEQISIVCERNFPRNTKGGLTTRLLLKNIRVFVVVVLFRRCCVVVAESCSSLFHVRVQRSPLGKRRAKFPQKKRALCSLLRCFCRRLTNGGGV